MFEEIINFLRYFVFLIESFWGCKVVVFGECVIESLKKKLVVNFGWRWCCGVRIVVRSC